jgi:hypothetical protein
MRRKEETRTNRPRERERKERKERGFAAICLVIFPASYSGKHISSCIKVVLGLERSNLISLLQAKMEKT